MCFFLYICHLIIYFNSQKIIVMKKVFAVLATAVVLFSCSSASGPEKVAKKFTENLAVGKVDEAKKYATEPAAKMLDLASAFGRLPLEPDFKLEAIKDSVVDNKAWVTYTNPKGKVETMELVKIDGEWLVHMESKK